METVQEAKGIQQIKLWHVMMAIRCLWTAFPQRGYVHPDEHFQTAEVVAGDVLDIGVFRSWEFDPTTPIRSMFVPCLILKPALTILQVFNIASCSVGGPSLINTYTMLTIPRSAILLLSLFTDKYVYLLSKMFKGVDTDRVMLLYTSSYISLVYFTRTLTNTFEAFLLVLLMYVIQKDLKRIERFFTCNPRSRFTRTTRHEHPEPFGPMDWYEPESVVCLSTILVIGFFNRPTFLFFAAFPYCYWLLDGHYPTSMRDFRLAMPYAIDSVKICMWYCLPVVVVILAWDSFYYSDPRHWDKIEFHYNSGGSISHIFRPREGILSTLTITPINFICYNIKGSNLAEHGLHPLSTHIMVNQLLLFGPMCVYLYVELALYLIHKFTQPNLNSTINFNDLRVFAFTFIVSIVLFSMFPHQEARFLIPLLYPTVMVFSHVMNGKQLKKLFWVSWVIFNFAGCMFYGGFHQGALINSIDFVRTMALKEPGTTSIHAIYSHTYMPPKNLFLIRRHITGKLKHKVIRQQNVEILHNLMNPKNYERTYVPSSKLHVYDMKGNPLVDVEKLIVNITKMYGAGDKIFLIAPSTIEETLCKASRMYYTYVLIQTFPWHVSMEDPPRLTTLFNRTTDFVHSKCNCNKQCDLHHWLKYELSLNLYQVFT